ncbi:MAG: gliding motility-associated C-terminal domain-containing protein [Flavobacteriales bacterium]|nr:gliding motility-associated C-terminal domain-containing protein [Flavobacteriales bacterium]
MKKLLFYSLFSFFCSISYSQEIAVYDFENLNLGDLTAQDGWTFSTSLATTNTGYNCPVIGSPIIPQIASMPTEGDYNSSKAIRSGDGWGSQHAIMSRLNDASWSFPSFQNRQYLVVSFEMTGGCWGKMFRLAYDQNNDGNFGQNCGQADPNEASFGISWFGCGTPNNITLFGANSQQIAQEQNYAQNGWIKYALIIDFYANNNQGSVSVFTKNLSNSESWTAVPSMQNINAGFDISSNGANNPYTLNGIMLDHEAGSNSTFDNISFTTLNYNKLPDTTLCEGGNVNIGQLINGATYEWNTGETTPVINVTNDGQYFVNIKYDDLTIIRDTVNVTIQNMIVDLGNDTSFCEGQSIKLFANLGMDSYLWQDSSTSNYLQIDSTGTYSVSVTKGGCSDADTISVQEIQPPYVNLGNDTVGCPGTDLRLSPSTNATGFKWQDGSTESSLKVNKSGQYHVKASIDQCVNSDTINVIFLHPLTLGNDTTICEGDYFTLNIDTTYEDYSWNDGDKKSYKDIHYDGEYFLTVKKLGCTIDSDTLIVKRTLLPRILEPMKDSLICENFPLVLKAYADRNEGIVWHDFHTDTFTMVRTGGIYWAKAYNECGEAIDSVKISSEDCECNDYIPNVFTPNKDGLNDYFGFQSNCIPSKYYNLKIYSRWGDLLFESNDYRAKWDGTHKGRVCPTGVYSYIIQLQYKHDRGKRTISRRIKITQ